MKITEAIEKMSIILREHGDIELCTYSCALGDCGHDSVTYVETEFITEIDGKDIETEPHVLIG